MIDFTGFPILTTATKIWPKNGHNCNFVPLISLVLLKTTELLKRTDYIRFLLAPFIVWNFLKYTNVHDFFLKVHWSLQISSLASMTLQNSLKFTAHILYLITYKNTYFHCKAIKIVLV